MSTSLPPGFVDILQRHGRSLADWGSNEMALERPQALAAIDALAGSSVAILGGDVWDLVGGMEATGYSNWYCDRHEGELAEDFAARSREAAREYIASYPDPEDGSTVYTLVAEAQE